MGHARRSPSPTAWSIASPRRPRRASALLLADNFGIDDNWPVFCEELQAMGARRQFPGRPPGARKGRRAIRPDVAPYEHMKIRILNGGHATIAYPAGLMDIHFVHEAMQHPLVARLPRPRSRTRRDHPRRAPGARYRPRRLLQADASAASPIPRSATPSSASASTARTASPNSSCPRRSIGWRPANPSPGWRWSRRSGARYCYGTTDSAASRHRAQRPNWDRLTAHQNSPKPIPRPGCDGRHLWRPRLATRPCRGLHPRADEHYGPSAPRRRWNAYLGGGSRRLHG
jgi:mannitol 2-dehydrogenase